MVNNGKTEAIAEGEEINMAWVDLAKIYFTTTSPLDLRFLSQPPVPFHYLCLKSLLHPFFITCLELVPTVCTPKNSSQIKGPSFSFVWWVDCDRNLAFWLRLFWNSGWVLCFWSRFLVLSVRFLCSMAALSCLPYAPWRVYDKLLQNYQLLLHNSREKRDMVFPYSYHF